MAKVPPERAFEQPDDAQSADDLQLPKSLEDLIDEPLQVLARAWLAPKVRSKLEQRGAWAQQVAASAPDSELVDVLTDAEIVAYHIAVERVATLIYEQPRVTHFYDFDEVRI